MRASDLSRAAASGGDDGAGEGGGGDNFAGGGAGMFGGGGDTAEPPQRGARVTAAESDVWAWGVLALRLFEVRNDVACKDGGGHVSACRGSATACADVILPALCLLIVPRHARRGMR